MNHYFLLLGNAYQLAQAEITTVLGRYDEPSPIAHHDLVEVSTHLHASALIDLLGGTVKIYQPLTRTSSVQEAIVADCLDQKPKHLAFSALSGIDIRQSAFQVKQALAQQSLPVRYRLLKKPSDSAGIIKKDTEYLFTHTTKMPQVLKCVAVQDIDRWSQKDYGRPVADPKSGMLPPKISRMLVNISLAHAPNTSTVVFDPMCGMGTILMEALDLNCQVRGSDIDEQALKGAQKNLDWFNETFSKSPSVTLTLHNIQQPDPSLPDNSLDAVVFEGYLGPPSIKPEKIDNYLRGLTKMYLGAFKHLNRYLKPGARLVAAVPAYVQQGSVKTLSSLIDRCEKLGYTPLYQDLFYFRPKAKVRRQILIWQKA